METLVKAVTFCVGLVLLLMAIAWLGDSTDAVRHFADANPTPNCHVIEATKTQVRYLCSDGREVTKKRKIEGR